MEVLQRIKQRQGDGNGPLRLFQNLSRTASFWARITFVYACYKIVQVRLALGPWSMYMRPWLPAHGARACRSELRCSGTRA